MQCRGPSSPLTNPAEETPAGRRKTGVFLENTEKSSGTLLNYSVALRFAIQIYITSLMLLTSSNPILLSKVKRVE
jgi:hypothetical protein